MPLVDKKKRLAWSKRYREVHREQIRADDRKRYWENPLRSRQYVVDREKARIRGRRCYWKNREKMLMESMKRGYLNKIEVFTQYSTSEYPSCAYCGETDVRVLQIDHIDGGGRQHRKEIKKSAGKEFYAWLKKQDFPKGFQVLCANCNIKKDYEMRNLYVGMGAEL